MAISSITKQKIKQQYIGGSSVPELAKLHGVSYATINTWKNKDGDWDTLRDAQRLGAGSKASRAQDIIDKALALCDVAFKRLSDTEMIDDPFETVKALTALVANLERMSKVYSKLTPPQESRLITAMEVLQDVGDALKECGKADVFDEISEQVASACLKRYGRD